MNTRTKHKLQKHKQIIIIRTRTDNEQIQKRKQYQTLKKEWTTKANECEIKHKCIITTYKTVARNKYDKHTKKGTRLNNKWKNITQLKQDK